jgi:DNA polymerase
VVQPIDADLAAEAVAALADARETLAELIEEGIDGWDPAQALAAEPVIAAPVPPDAPAPQASLDSKAPEAAPAPARDAAPKDQGWGSAPTLDRVRDELGDCQRCGLCEGRNSIVFGDGNPDADILFVGEGPGEQEDKRGLPFVGRAGELLTQMIEKGIDIPRSSVYICNIVKCRPPKNRTPLPAEVNACRPFLDGQIDAVQPKVIVSLGKPAASLLLGRDVAITRERGTWHEYRGIPLMPTLHPAYVLRDYSPENRRNVWEDLKAALAKSRE